MGYLWFFSYLSFYIIICSARKSFTVRRPKDLFRSNTLLPLPCSFSIYPSFNNSSRALLTVVLVVSIDYKKHVLMVNNYLQDTYLSGFFLYIFLNSLIFLYFVQGRIIIKMNWSLCNSIQSSVNLIFILSKIFSNQTF